MVGGAIAGLQAPELFSDFSAYLGFDGMAAGAAAREFSDMSINMLAGIAIAVFSLFATFSTERI